MRKPSTKAKFGKRRRKVTKTITMPVSTELIKQALEYYWRQQTTIKDNEDVTIDLPFTKGFDVEVKIETDKGVESKLIHGKDGLKLRKGNGIRKPS